MSELKQFENFEIPVFFDSPCMYINIHNICKGKGVINRCLNSRVDACPQNLVYWWVWLGKILKTANFEYCGFWGTSMTKSWVLTTCISLSILRNICLRRQFIVMFPSSSPALHCTPEIYNESTLFPRPPQKLGWYKSGIFQQVAFNDHEDLSPVPSFVSGAPQQSFYYSIVAIPPSTLGSWVDWSCRICRTASNWVCVCLLTGWSEAAGSWSVSRQSGDNARTPGHDHQGHCRYSVNMHCYTL